jgi:hypothetical protein
MLRLYPIPCSSRKGICGGICSKYVRRSGGVVKNAWEEDGPHNINCGEGSFNRLMILGGGTVCVPREQQQPCAYKLLTDLSLSLSLPACLRRVQCVHAALGSGPWPGARGRFLSWPVSACRCRSIRSSGRERSVNPPCPARLLLTVPRCLL